MTSVSPAWPTPRTHGRVASCSGPERDVWTASRAVCLPREHSGGRYRGPRRCSRGRASHWSRWFCSRQLGLVAGRDVSLLLFVAAGPGANLRGPGRLSGPVATWRHQTTSGSGFRTTSTDRGGASDPVAPAVPAVFLTMSTRSDWAETNEGLDQCRGIKRFCWPGSRVGSRAAGTHQFPPAGPVITVAWIGGPRSRHPGWLPMLLDEWARPRHAGAHGGPVFTAGGRHRTPLASPPPGTPGGASHLVGGGPLALVAALFWLAACMDARLWAWPGCGVARSAERRTGDSPGAALAPRWQPGPSSSWPCGPPIGRNLRRTVTRRFGASILAFKSC